MFFCKKIYYLCSMERDGKTVKVLNPIHEVLKKRAHEKGLKFERYVNDILSNYIDGLAKVQTEPKEEPKPKETKKKETKKKETKSPHLFVNSNVSTLQTFVAEFINTDWAQRMRPIDPVKLFHSVKNWSESNAKKRVNWMATAYTFVSKNPDEYRPDNYNGNPKDKQWIDFYNKLIELL